MPPLHPAIGARGRSWWVVWLLALGVAGVLVLAHPVAAQDTRDWTTTNTILGFTASVAILSDWTTTVDMARRGRREGGPGRLLLGEYPQLATVNRVFLINALVGVVAADRVFTNKRSPVLGLSWRNLFLGTVTVVEGGFGVRNHVRGVRFNLRF